MAITTVIVNQTQTVVANQGSPKSIVVNEAKGEKGDPGAAGALTVQDEGVSLTTAATKINFVGAGVTATAPVANEILVTIGAGAGAGDVFGPASSINNHVVFFDGTTGKLLKDSGLTLSGTNTGDQTNITGNAATVTTNANLTGVVTSVGNATSIANGAISNAMLANSAVANLSGTNTGDQIISDATITITDITTNNFTTAAHGFVPKGTNVGNFLKDDGTWAAVSVVGGANQTLSNLTNPTAINQSLLFNSSTNGLIASADGFTMSVKTGNATTGVSGIATLASGDSVSNNTGNISIFSGSTVSGVQSGHIDLKTGSAGFIGVQAAASIATTVPIVLTAITYSTARNTNTFTLEILPVAANPTNTILVSFTGTAAAIVCTVTPNDGTNNGATAVDLTTANLVELINTGLVTGKTITITDASSLRVNQTAAGGNTVNLIDGGEGDGLVAIYSGGLNPGVKGSIRTDAPVTEILVQNAKFETINYNPSNIGAKTWLSFSAGGIIGRTTGGTPLSIATAESATASSTNDILIQTGTNTSTGNSGSFRVIVGSAGGTQGSFKFLKTGVAPTPGDVWTATNADGSGYWGPAIPELSVAYNKETFVLSGGETYIDLLNVALEDSIHFVVRGLGPLMEGASYDYSVSYTGGAGSKTRITFLNNLAALGSSELIAGDIIQVTYQYAL